MNVVLRLPAGRSCAPFSAPISLGTELRSLRTPPPKFVFSKRCPAKLVISVPCCRAEQASDAGERATPVGRTISRRQVGTAAGILLALQSSTQVAQAAENSFVEKALNKYVKRKKLDPLETYVPTMILAQDQLVRAGRKLAAPQPDYMAVRSMLRSGATSSLRGDIRAVATYAAEAGQGQTATAAVDQCLSSIEELDAMLLNARVEKNLSLQPLQDKLSAAIGALDRLLATVPSAAFDKGNRIAAAYRNDSTPSSSAPEQLSSPLPQEVEKRGLNKTKSEEDFLEKLL